MRTFNYSAIKEQKWDSDVLGLIAAIYKEAGKQELYLKQRPEELEKLVEIAKIQSTEASNAIEGIVTTSTRIRQLVEEKTTPRNRDEQEIAGYRDVLSIIHESFDAIPITQNYILQLHKILYSHINNPLAGRTKSVQNYITATYPDGHVETLFTPLAPYETPEALDRICEEYNRVIGNMELEPLIAIPVFIHTALRKKELVDSLVNEIKLQATTALKQEIVRKTNEKLRRVIVDDYVEIESIDRYIKLKGRDGASEGQTLSIAYCFLGTLFEDSELEFPFIIDSPTGKMDFEKRQAVADIIPLVFNQMIAFVQSAEVERFADRFYANPDSQYLTVVASPQDQAVVVYEGIDFFDSYQREHKGDEK